MVWDRKRENVSLLGFPFLFHEVLLWVRNSKKYFLGNIDKKFQSDEEDAVPLLESVEN